MGSSPVTRNESHVGFLLEPVHSSTPPFVSGTVRSRPLAAKVKPAPTPPLFRRPAMAPMAILRHGLKLWPRGTAERAAREASLRVELLPHHRAAYMPSGPRLLSPPEVSLRRPLSGPSDGAKWARHPHSSLDAVCAGTSTRPGDTQVVREPSGASRGRASSRSPSRGVLARERPRLQPSPCSGPCVPVASKVGSHDPYQASPVPPTSAVAAALGA